MTQKLPTNLCPESGLTRDSFLYPFFVAVLPCWDAQMQWGEQRLGSFASVVFVKTQINKTKAMMQHLQAWWQFAMNLENIPILRADKSQQQNWEEKKMRIKLDDEIISGLQTGCRWFDKKAHQHEEYHVPEANIQYSITQSVSICSKFRESCPCSNEI